jgi:hypothetical protein
MVMTMIMIDQDINEHIGLFNVLHFDQSIYCILGLIQWGLPIKGRIPFMEGRRGASSRTVGSLPSENFSKNVHNCYPNKVHGILIIVRTSCYHDILLGTVLTWFPVDAEQRTSNGPRPLRHQRATLHDQVPLQRCLPEDSLLQIAIGCCCLPQQSFVETGQVGLSLRIDQST